MGIKKFIRTIAPILGPVGDIVGGFMANSAQKQSNKANIALQRENQAWQERMANTEWQRGTKDMLAAGLNPMLAYSQGGASTPSTSPATVEPVSGLAKGVSSAAQKQAQILQLKRMGIDNNIASQKLLQEEITTDYMQEKFGAGNYVGEEMEQMRSQTGIKASDARIREIEKKIMEETEGAQVSSATQRAELLKKEVSLAELKVILAGLDIPEKEAMAKWFNTVGAASPAAKAIMSVSQWLKFILGR